MYPIYKTGIDSINPSKSKNGIALQPAENMELQKKPSWEYYEPPENWNTVQFCQDTSLHGLHYVGQRERHCCERIFWLIAFLGVVVTAALFISQLWASYMSMPIVTVFNPIETTIKEIPFPAVTVCNVNNLKMSIFDDYTNKVRAMKMKNAMNGGTEEELNQAFAKIYDIQNICNVETFAKRLVRHSGKPWTNRYSNITQDLLDRKQDYLNFSNPMQTLSDGTQKCEEMILFCLWHGKVYNCSELFQEVETDYGYCCTFNTIPLTLLMRFINDSRDDPATVTEWANADLNYDNLIFTEETRNRTYPYRQLYPGRSAGLSFLLEPGLAEYSCTNTDSEGYVVGVNVPLDFPRVNDNGVLVRTGSELYINIRPQITKSANSIQKFSLEKRNCYFNGEHSLPHYSKYTTSNCIAECIANRTKITCGCVLYYMPRGTLEELCKPEQYDCVENVKNIITEIGLSEGCQHCRATCTEIDYLAEATSLNIRKNYIARLFKAYYPDQNQSFEDVSLVHVYFSQDSVYPRLRKEMHSIIDLISNTGGLLGLCMGFSMLSVLEIFYYCTIRLCFQHRRKRLKQAEAEQQNSDPFSTSENNKENGWLAKFFLRFLQMSKNEDAKGLPEDPIFKLVRNANYPPKITPRVYDQPSFYSNFQPSLFNPTQQEEGSNALGYMNMA